MKPPFRDAAGRHTSRGAEARQEEAPEGMPLAPTCPFCEGVETEVMSTFGAHASVSTYWCRACRSPFEVLKWRARP